MGVKSSNKKEFYRDLAKIMIKHGFRDIKWLSCKVGDEGRLRFNKDHLLVPDDDRTYLNYSDDAEKVIRDSLVDLSLDLKNKKQFKRAMTGKIISDSER
jgi:hypothetical protein